MGSTTNGEVHGVEKDAIVMNLDSEHHQEQPLTHAEIERFREQLEQLRDWLLESIAKVEQQGNTVGVSDDGHDQFWQGNITQRALAEKRALLHEVVQAFERIKANTYGRCVADDASLPRTLLEDVPWARFCSDCAGRIS